MRITLEEACESIADGDHQAPPKSDEGIPFITISCLDPDGGRPGYSAATKVPVAYYESLSDNRRAKCGDVLLSVVGSLGIPYLVKEDDRFVFQRHIAILRPGRHLVPEYLYYLLRSPALFHYIDSIAQGAAQRTLTLTQLRSMEIELPPLETQRCIASILMAYDNLIANNRKQIALLEEAAQRLYKEWFIDLRFPGHEDVEDVDGQPQGWRWCLFRNTLISSKAARTSRRTLTLPKACPWSTFQASLHGVDTNRTLSERMGAYTRASRS